jgi:hypothetical protein
VTWAGGPYGNFPPVETTRPAEDDGPAHGRPYRNGPAVETPRPPPAPTALPATPGSRRSASVRYGHTSTRFPGAVVPNIVQAQADDKIAKIEMKQAQAQETEAERMERVVKLLETKPDGETASGIKEHVGCNDKAWKPILKRLLDSGRIVECQVKRERRNYRGFRLA